MGGGLMQLVAYGAQDIYLTGNPQITFFKVVYRRHTNFSMEAIEQTWNGSSGAGAGSAGRCTATISRNGDLIHDMYIEVSGTSHATPDIKNPTSQCITNIELEIGGQRIDKHSGQFMETWAELTEPNSDMKVGLVGGAATFGTPFQLMSGMGGTVVHDTPVECIYNIPIYFWFCKNPGLALPLIALQYHEVKVILDHNFSNGFKAAAANISQKLWVDYIYLDTDERRRFAQQSHEYLIEQVQEQSLSNPKGTSELNFNHPVKELIWNKFTGGAPVALSTIEYAPADTYLIKLNGHDRFAARHVSYFTRVQVNKHHSGCGGLDVPPGGDVEANIADGAVTGIHGIAVYSFALKPEEHQPSGTCNFSRIDTAQLVGSGNTVANTCFAINYNVLRIMSGMGGLAYSN